MNSHERAPPRPPPLIGFQVVASGVPTYGCGILGALFFCISFGIFVGTIVPTMARQVRLVLWLCLPFFWSKGGRGDRDLAVAVALLLRFSCALTFFTR